MPCGTCGTKTVLIVDDSEFDLLPLEVLLGDLFQVQVEKATGGQQAIDLFAADRAKSCCDSYFRLVFMDVNMPDVDGL